ncbi:helix-turn-helix domain-containing protein [Candidatus Megaera polyxenophila]|jgi:transcriptional regulator with XRE-family HTH domain|uniref:helix-turn-helix domain-containing protein n=1 Tax=Candidatus Megaera polyxenophila TaxID=988779 RepID=UPI00249DBE1C|nr:helix-turn-helix domain-containing protein [Candidatus Megaera polyxenophila]
MARKNDYIAKIDKFIGNKIASLRLSKGFSRKQLSEAVDITGQQLSKYEKGKNRVSIGRLILISKALGERVSYFYEGLETEVTYQLPIDQEEIRKEIVRNFMRLNSLEYQNAINQLIRLLLKDKIAEGNIRGYSNGTESR